ncbi:hypothetical protein EDEG_01367, partial [Edhazardia aedis USNM 41457]
MEKNSRKQFINDLDELMSPENVNSFLIYITENKKLFDTSLNKVVQFMLYKYEDERELLSKLKILLLANKNDQFEKNKKKAKHSLSSDNSEKKNHENFKSSFSKVSMTKNTESDNSCDESTKEIYSDEAISSDEDLVFYKTGTDPVLEEIICNILTLKGLKNIENIYESLLSVYEREEAIYKIIVHYFFRKAHFNNSNAVIKDLCERFCELWGCVLSDDSNSSETDVLSNSNMSEDIQKEKEKNCSGNTGKKKNVLSENIDDNAVNSEQKMSKTNKSEFDAEIESKKTKVISVLNSKDNNDEKIKNMTDVEEKNVAESTNIADTPTGCVVSNKASDFTTEITKNIESEDSDTLRKLDQAIIMQMKGIKYAKKLQSDEYKITIGKKYIDLIQIISKKYPITDLSILYQFCKIDQIYFDYNSDQEKKKEKQIQKLSIKNLNDSKKDKSVSKFNTVKSPKLCKVFFLNVFIEPGSESQFFKVFCSYLKKNTYLINSIYYLQSYCTRNSLKMKWEKIFKIIAKDSDLCLNSLDAKEVPANVVFKSVLKADNPFRYYKFLKRIIACEFDNNLIEKFLAKVVKKTKIKPLFKNARNDTFIVNLLENRLKTLKDEFKKKSED